jgi:hypothetical protein
MIPDAIVGSYPMVAFGELLSTLVESLILAQDERWRRA